MIFESLPTTPRSAELLDKAFSRASRSGRAKSGFEAQQSMLQTASAILADNLENVVTEWPDFSTVDPFYYELADAIVSVDSLRQSLSEVTWASRQVRELRSEYQRKMRDANPQRAQKHRKQAFARMADVVEEVQVDLRQIGDARDELKSLPDISPAEPAIVVAGYPNVGKSSFVNHVTRASNQIAQYPFTTTQIRVGHFDRNRIRYQIIDTPGLLDRPADNRNEIEQQAVSAVEHLADSVIFMFDASESCGYELSAQRELEREIRRRFEHTDVPVLTVNNKSDRLKGEGVGYQMSVKHSEGIEEILDAAIEAVDWEPEIPPSRQS